MSQPRESGRIQCRECGRWYRALPRHIVRTHDMDIDDYRLRHGIPVGVPLVCGEWSEAVSDANVARGSAEHLTARGATAGYRQRDSVRHHRAPDYRRLAAQGTASARAVDRTAARREALRPYPVTVVQAAARLGCSRAVAYEFLSACTVRGTLRRAGRGVYDEPASGTREGHDP